MVQLMGSLNSGNIEDFTEEEYGSLAKRSRLSATPLNQQLNSGSHTIVAPTSQYNPLDEPLPLGLSLKKSPSLLDLIQMKLSQGSSESISVKPTEVTDKNNVKGCVAPCVNDKLKASNFPASLLRIGSWEYISKYEGDLVAKCYFAKHKLVWEVLEGGLKSKIEIQWSDIMAVKADCPDNNEPGTLTIVLARRPAFFRETNPQPRKHTLWQATSDFTDGQASINKKHFIQFPTGVLNKHYEKLIQCDMRLYILSQRPEIVVDSPYFASQASACENSEESEGDGCNQLPPAAQGPPSAFLDAASSVSAQSSSFTSGQTPLAVRSVSKEAASPSSVMDTQEIEGNRISDEHDSGGQKSWESLKAPGIRPSMSVSDLVDHIGNCITDRRTSGSLSLDKASEYHDMLDHIAQDLLSDTQCASSTGLDENSLMKKVNSLCCLLQDPAVAPYAQVDGENFYEVADCGTVYFDLVNDSTQDKSGDVMQAPEGNIKDSSGCKQAPALPRRDSLVDMLIHLPSIASLPKFPKLFGIAEDNEY